MPSTLSVLWYTTDLAITRSDLSAGWMSHAYLMPFDLPFDSRQMALEEQYRPMELCKDIPEGYFARKRDLEISFEYSSCEGIRKNSIKRQLDVPDHEWHSYLQLRYC